MSLQCISVTALSLKSDRFVIKSVHPRPLSCHNLWFLFRKIIEFRRRMNGTERKVNTLFTFILSVSSAQLGQSVSQSSFQNRPQSRHIGLQPACLPWLPLLRSLSSILQLFHVSKQTQPPLLSAGTNKCWWNSNRLQKFHFLLAPALAPRPIFGLLIWLSVFV